MEAICKIPRGHDFVIGCFCLELNKCITFKIDENTLIISTQDENSTIGIDISRESLEEFNVRREYLFQVNVKHLQKLLQNVLRKQVVSLLLSGSKLTVRVASTNVVEEGSIVISIASPITPPSEWYKEPRLVSSKDRRSIKRFTSLPSTLSISSSGMTFASESSLIVTKVMIGDYSPALYTLPLNSNILNTIIKFSQLSKSLQFYIARDSLKITVESPLGILSFFFYTI